MASRLFGVPVKGLLAKHLGPGLPAGTYTQVVEGSRGADVLAGLQTTETEHSFSGFFESFSETAVDGTTILTGDRKLLVVAGTLSPGGFSPSEGDRATVDGAEVEVKRVLAIDPAGATWSLQVRDR